MNRAARAYGRRGELDPAERRRQLVERHAALVRRVATRIARTAPGVMELEDLFASGIVGLLQAGDSYDPAGGRPFEVYAEFRIKGAILDELRSRDPLPRRTRHRVNLVRRAIAHTRLLRGRDPTDDELAATLETTAAEIRQLRPFIVEPRHVDCHDDRIHVPSDLLPSDHLQKREERALVRAGLERLPERDRTLLALYYQEELSYKQVGKILGVSEATVCRQHKRALVRLREIVHRLPAPGAAGDAAGEPAMTPTEAQATPPARESV